MNKKVITICEICNHGMFENEYSIYCRVRFHNQVRLIRSRMNTNKCLSCGLNIKKDYLYYGKYFEYPNTSRRYNETKYHYDCI